MTNKQLDGGKIIHRTATLVVNDDRPTWESVAWLSIVRKVFLKILMKVVLSLRMGLTPIYEYTVDVFEADGVR